VGVITEVKPASVVTWEAPNTRYRWHGIPLTVDEGVTWTIEPHDGGAGVQVGAHVWAKFPTSAHGRLLEWVFFRLFKSVEKDREHARAELRYLKQRIEESVAQT
jgi:hypothetical protein